MKSAYINGEFCNVADAKISIFDRGFLFGDAVYEVLPVYNGQPFFVEQHIARLQSNLKKIKMDVPEIDWNDLIEQLILKNGAGDLQIYIQITRGNQNIRKHDIPAYLAPTIIGFTLHTPYPTIEEQTKGLKIKLVEDIRWHRCDIKTTSLLANILLNDDAVADGYHTSVMIRDGKITEGSTSNLFIVSQEGLVKTPKLTHDCLPGITRQIAIDLLKQLSWSFLETDITVDELIHAQEVWVTSTTKEIYPVTQVNELSINNGNVGAYWHTINNSYQQLTKKS